MRVVFVWLLCRMPDAKILPVALDGPASETAVFTRFLSTLADNWTLGSGYNISWPDCVGTNVTSSDKAFSLV